MAVTRDSLRTAYPEFDRAPDALIDAHIANAESSIDRDVFGDSADLAVLLKACHLIASSQYGERLALKSDENKSPYFELYNALAKSAGASWRLG